MAQKPKTTIEQRVSDSDEVFAGQKGAERAGNTNQHHCAARFHRNMAEESSSDLEMNAHLEAETAHHAAWEAHKLADKFASANNLSSTDSPSLLRIAAHTKSQEARKTSENVRSLHTS